VGFAHTESRAAGCKKAPDVAVNRFPASFKHYVSNDYNTAYTV